MLKLTDNYLIDESVAYIINTKKQIDSLQLLPAEIEYADKMLEGKTRFVHINSFYKSSFIILINNEKDIHTREEEVRNSGFMINSVLQKLKTDTLNIIDLTDNNYSLFLAEGLLLSNYRFNKYFKDKEEKVSYLKEVKLVNAKIPARELEKMESLITGVFHSRDIVNEPLSYMTAKKLAEEVEIIGKQYGIKTEVLDKKKIESLKMGGILAVNRGSIEPPTFSIMQWTPADAVNEKPVVLVGKGIVFDTGGMDLKPSSSMETMKSDKAGAAAVIGTMAAIAKANIPVKVIGLIPATENRPGENAYVPEDIIRMYDGTTVEVMNTDAEGRIILADALAYAKQFNPELVIDLATLTGAAVVAVGESATVVMGNDDESISNLKISGFKVWERLIELPLWDEYAKDLESSVADMKNIGGRYGGAIIAGKFLEHFTDYKWVHLDIAGPAFSEKQDSYRGLGGTGLGVRLLFNFLNEIVNNSKKNIDE